MRKKKNLEGVNSSLVRGPIKKWAWLFILPTFAAFCIGFVWPFIQGIYLSFCKFNVPSDATWNGIENYVKVFKDAGFRNAFKNTASFAVATIVIINVISFAIAYAPDPENAGLQPVPHGVFHAEPHRRRGPGLHLEHDF